MKIVRLAASTLVLLVLAGCSGGVTASVPPSPDISVVDQVAASQKAASDKAAADKSAADKVVADKAAAEQAEVDKVMADKAAADKATPEVTSQILRPTGGEKLQLLAGLSAIDPGLSQYDFDHPEIAEGRGVRRSISTCSDIMAGESAALVQSQAKARFEGGTVPLLSATQVRNIITVIKSTFCQR